MSSLSKKKKKDMSRTFKRLLIIVVSVVAAAALASFVLYKIFVTPNRIVLLSMARTIGSAQKTMNFAGDDEKELLGRIVANGGSVEMDAEFKDVPIIKTLSTSVSLNSNGKNTVTDIKLARFINMSVYKDDEQILINSPIGEYKMPVRDFAEGWDASIFKDMAPLPVHHSGPLAMVKLLGSGMSPGEFYNQYKNELVSLIEDCEVKRTGRASVMTGADTVRAKEYTLKLKKSDSEQILNMLVEYIEKKNGMHESDGTAEVKQMLAGYVDDYTIVFRIKKFTVYEVDFKDSEGNTITISLTGGGNPADNIMLRSNDGTEIRRIHGGQGGKVTERIEKNGDAVLKYESDNNGFELYMDLGDHDLRLKTAGRKMDRNSLEYGSIDFEIEDSIKFEGDIEISEEYDKDYTFINRGGYKNLLEITESEWNTISAVFTGGRIIAGILR